MGAYSYRGTRDCAGVVSVLHSARAILAGTILNSQEIGKFAN